MQHQPRKRFGQHFLHDDGVIAKIIASLNPKLADHLIEIGPGQGALTVPILEKISKLDVIELDRDLIPNLLNLKKSKPGLVIHEGSALDFNFTELKTDDRPLRIFGNLPYNISTPLIFHLLTFANNIHDMLFMLQKEVADRLAANASSDAYGRLSVMVQYFCRVELLFDVAPESFTPPPKVQSSIVRLVPYESIPFLANDYKKFADLVKHAFGQRRKTLRNSLRDFMSDELWKKIGINPMLRAENLSVSDYVQLANLS